MSLFCACLSRARLSLLQYIDGLKRGAVFRGLLRLHDVVPAEEDRLQRRLDAAVAATSAALPTPGGVAGPAGEAATKVTELGGGGRLQSAELALQFRTGAIE